MLTPVIQKMQGSISEWGRSPGQGHGNPPQYYCLENPMGKRAWWATVLHGLTNSRTWFSDWALECANWSIVTESTLVVVKRASPVAQVVKNQPAMQETLVPFLVREDPLQKGKGYPFQYSGPENSMVCIVHGVANTQTTDCLSFKRWWWGGTRWRN